MMVKMEDEDEDRSALVPAAGAEPMSPLDGDYYYEGDEEEEEDDDEQETTDSDEGDRRGAREPPLKKGPWTPEEDKRLRDYVQANGEGNWNQVRINAGLNRCGKSCRLRWSNHLRPDLKKGPFEDDEVHEIIRMHMAWGNKWSKMARRLPGRTDNEIKNFWNTRLKRHQRAGLPIYPEYLVSQASNQGMDFGTPEASHGTKRPNELSQNVLVIDDLMNDYFDHDTFVKHVPVPDMGDLPCPSLLHQNSLPMDAMKPLKLINSSSDYIASGYNDSLSFAQIPDESGKAACSTSFNYGMIDNQLAPPGTAIISGHPMLDGHPSSSWTVQRLMKMELPSVQYSNYGLSNAWVGDCTSGPSGSIEQADTLIGSPGSLKSEYSSSQNIGLDAKAHKGDVVDPISYQGVFEVPRPPFPCNQVSQSNAHTIWQSCPSVPGDDEIDGCPLREVQASISPSSADAIPADSNCYPDTSRTDTLLSSWTEIGMHGAPLEARMLNDESPFSKDHDHSFSIYNSFIDGNSSDANLSTAEPGCDSFPWNNMPGANMSDFSNP